MTKKLFVACAVALVAAGAARAGGFDGPTIANPTRVPDFALRDQSGHLVRLSDERGKVVLLTFMYTRCRGLCPLTAVHLDTVALEARTKNLSVLAVSVDPKGDTASAVRAFVRSHGLHSEFHYLTGPEATMRSIWSAYHVRPRATARTPTTRCTRCSSTRAGATASSTTRPRSPLRSRTTSGFC